MQHNDMRYLKLLSELFPNINAASAEVVNLQTVLELPKGTEHFMSDIHGEDEAFLHVMHNCSGVIRRHIDELFANKLSELEMNELAALIYYPKERLELTFERIVLERHSWCMNNLKNILVVLRQISSKYTRKKVRKAMPPGHEFLIEELIHAMGDPTREQYLQDVLTGIVQTGRAPDMIISLSAMIRDLTVDRLHIVGDIFDRGPGADIIMDYLTNLKSIDFQWGNHDILWMGACAGSEVSLCCALRISLRYTNLRTIEEGYGISLLPLATYAMDTYRNDPCSAFKTKKSGERDFSTSDLTLYSKMHKALSIIQFKLEGQLIERNPQFAMDDRIMLPTMDLEAGTIKINGKTHPLLDKHFPTFDPKNPHKLSEAEERVVESLLREFRHSVRLHKHVEFLFNYGSMYKTFNGTLLLHGCIPMDEEGNFREFRVGNAKLSGKAYVDRLDELARQSWHAAEDSHERRAGLDTLYFLWTGPASPLFGKARMTTFERYFIADKTTHKEPRDPYYAHRMNADMCRKILREFGCPETGRIINGHTPVKVKKGEIPVKADGRLMVIDGGFSKAYQGETGIAGYTLIHNSYGFMLAEHKAFKGRDAAINELTDNHARTSVVERASRRILIRDTDLGKELTVRVKALKALLQAFESGHIKERGMALYSRL